MWYTSEHMQTKKLFHGFYNHTQQFSFIYSTAEVTKHAVLWYKHMSSLYSRCNAQSNLSSH